MSTLRLPIALQQAVMRRLRHDLAQANRILNTDHSEPKISYQQRGTTAGSAYPLSWEIRLNPLLLRENGQTFIDEVVPHELAHLLVYRTYGKVAPHGKEWQYMMEQVLNVSANRTHQFNIASVQGKTFPYRCKCQQHMLTSRRHNRIKKGETEYRCKQCREILQLVSEAQPQ